MCICNAQWEGMRKTIFLFSMPPLALLMLLVRVRQEQQQQLAARQRVVAISRHASIERRLNELANLPNTNNK